METKDGLIVKLDPDEIEGMRNQLSTTAKLCYSIPYDRDDTEEHSQYWRGKPYRLDDKGKWVLEFGHPPETFDCSGLIKYVFGANLLYIPDGANGQWNWCNPVKEPQVGDLAFAQNLDGYKNHVGMYIGDGQIIEARALDEKASFKTGGVIIRPQEKWEAWQRFAGYRSHRFL